MILFSEKDILDINTLSRFLACSQVSSLHTCVAVDVLVFCGNAILPIAEAVFTALEARANLAKTVVLCGGIGHSTQWLYKAVRGNEKYTYLADSIGGLPEAAVYELILKRHHTELAGRFNNGEIKLIIEDKSQNCGANAIQTRRVLELNAISTLKSCIVVQDPTMSLRTLAAFQHTYRDVSPSPEFFACPIFIPQVQLEGTGNVHIVTDQDHSTASINSADLWCNDRFFDLVMGEIPRLRDDENGYGPKGKGFIAHVEITSEVEDAWKRLRNVLNSKR